MLAALTQLSVQARQLSYSNKRKIDLRQRKVVRETGRQSARWETVSEPS